MNKTCLFLKAAVAACADEADVISAHLKSMHVDTELIEWISIDDFTERVVGKKFEIIYLGAHADCSGFGESKTSAELLEERRAQIKKLERHLQLYYKREFSRLRSGAEPVAQKFP